MCINLKKMENRKKRRRINNWFGFGKDTLNDLDTSQQAPGTWVVGEPVELKEVDSNELYSFDDYYKEAKDLRAFQRQFNFPYLGTIFYPCSGHDPAPFLTFGSSRVVHIDKNELAIKTLKSIKAEAYHASVDAFDFVGTIGNKANILYVLNPQVKLTEDWIDDCLEVEGYVICNNYHGTAVQLSEFKSLKIVGIMQGDTLIRKVETDVIKEIIRYKRDNSDALYTPYVDNRFIFRKIK